MTHWFQRTDLNLLLNLDGVTEARFLNALDLFENQDFLKMQKQIFQCVTREYKLSDKDILYDVTNTYLYGKKCPLGKWGKDKDGVRGRPLIQIGLGVTQKDGVPLFHKTYDGNIHDSRTFQDAITLFEDYKIKDGMVVFDRGIPSEKNCKDIEALGWKVLCGLKADGGLKRFVSPILKDEPRSE